MSAVLDTRPDRHGLGGSEVPGEAARSVAAALGVLLALSAAVVLASWAGLAAYYAKSTFHMDDAASVHVGLAVHVNQGTLYPDLYDGRYYGGTRYMPLSFVLHAGLARLTGEYLLSGKLLTSAFAVLLLMEVLLLLRYLGCPWPLALGLAGLILASKTGFYVCTTIRGDLPSVVLQLAALLVGWGSPSYRRVALAALLCTLAVLAKMTALWAVPALAGAWLLGRDWRRAGTFAAVWLATLGLALAALHVGTSGRMLANFAALSTSGIGGLRSLLKVPLNLLIQFGSAAFPVQVLAPFALLECVWAWRQRRWSPCHSGLVFCLPILLLILADMGAGQNHLLDVCVLSAVVVGGLGAALRGARGGDAWGLNTLLALSVLWGLWGAWTGVMYPWLRDTRSAARKGTHVYPAKPLAGLIREGETILSESSLIPVAHGQVPVVLDFYALARLRHTRPELIEPLLGRIRNQEFAKVVLRHRVEGKDYDRTEWDAADFYLGRPVVEAVHRHYRCLRTVGNFDIFVPATPARRQVARSQGAE